MLPHRLFLLNFAANSPFFFAAILAFEAVHSKYCELSVSHRPIIWKGLNLVNCKYCIQIIVGDIPNKMNDMLYYEKINLKNEAIYIYI